MYKLNKIWQKHNLKNFVTIFNSKFLLHFVQVIRGWDEGVIDEGVIGMCVGEKRQLIVPSGKTFRITIHLMRKP